MSGSCCHPAPSSSDGSDNLEGSSVSSSAPTMPKHPLKICRLVGFVTPRKNNAPGSFNWVQWIYKNLLVIGKEIQSSLMMIHLHPFFGLFNLKKQVNQQAAIYLTLCRNPVPILSTYLWATRQAGQAGQSIQCFLRCASPVAINFSHEADEPAQTDEQELECIQKTWRSSIYAFYKGDVSIEQ
ncbi:hypothetical protein BT96DRAFT_942251 [Gymnopus androsaceus JB14]|uniref:Uncharacterized protein n=1 Tax=Gymnopus androsaceus JB14 TaxID=1447944 RepID=A0A6A4HD92_9AGAR|nr:hypothetical protein BT96DRAFT_942251 [Gymnopus androsaceus JB14]